MSVYTVTGFLKSINEYNQLQISLTEDQTKIIKGFSENQGYSALTNWKGKDEVIRYNLKVVLAPKDKNVARNFQKITNMVGKRVRVSVEATTYDFEDQKKNRVVGWKATMQSMYLTPKQTEEVDQPKKEA